MKILHYVFLLLLGSPFLSVAQSYEGSIEYNKKKQQAFENAIVQKIERMGYKGKEEKGVFNKDKGFRVYKDAYISEISDRSMDYIIKVERKSRKDKDATTVYLLINKDGENAMKDFSSTEIRRAKDFLNSLMPDVEAANLELQIRAQEELISKTEKKLRNLQDDKKTMEEKIRKLENDIKSNEKDQSNTQEEINNQRMALEALRGKRKA